MQGVLFFQYKLLKKLRKSYFKFVRLPGKVINVIQSFRFQLYETITDYLSKFSQRRAPNEREWGDLPCPFLKIEQCPALEKSALFVCIYGLNSHLKYSFKSIVEKKHQNFFRGAFLLYAVHETFMEVPLFQETCPDPKNSQLRARAKLTSKMFGRHINKSIKLFKVINLLFIGYFICFLL